MHRDKLSAYMEAVRAVGSPEGLCSASESDLAFLWREGHCVALANQSLVLCSELPNPRQTQGRLSGEKVPELEMVILEERA